MRAGEDDRNFVSNILTTPFFCDFQESLCPSDPNLPSAGARPLPVDAAAEASEAADAIMAARNPCPALPSRDEAAELPEPA